MSGIHPFRRSVKFGSLWCSAERQNHPASPLFDLVWPRWSQFSWDDFSKLIGVETSRASNVYPAMKDLDIPRWYTVLRPTLMQEKNNYLYQEALQRRQRSNFLTVNNVFGPCTYYQWILCAGGNDTEMPWRHASPCGAVLDWSKILESVSPQVPLGRRCSRWFITGKRNQYWTKLCNSKA